MCKPVEISPIKMALTVAIFVINLLLFSDVAGEWAILWSLVITLLATRPASECGPWFFERLVKHEQK